MPRPFPAPDTRNPLILPDGSVHDGTVFLKSVIDHPRIDVGDYSYASAHVPPDDWAAHLAPYLSPFSAERLAIGRFCQIADGALFITASANHRRDGFSTYPFAVFDGFGDHRASLPGPGPDTVIGNDVWIGQGARIQHLENRLLHRGQLNGGIPAARSGKHRRDAAHRRIEAAAHHDVRRQHGAEEIGLGRREDGHQPRADA